MRRHLAYLSYVLRHKWFVFLACLKLGVPIWIAILHDWDKFLPDEWFPYARTFYTPDGKHRYIEGGEFAYAWMLHQHRNRHHWQYWLQIGCPSENCIVPLRDIPNALVWDRGTFQYIARRNSGGTEWLDLTTPSPHEEYITADPMPDVYRREMLADWIGAGRALGKPKTWEWWYINKDKMHLHDETRAWLETQITEMKREYDDFERGQSMGLA